MGTGRSMTESSCQRAALIAPQANGKSRAHTTMILGRAQRLEGCCSQDAVCSVSAGTTCIAPLEPHNQGQGMIILTPAATSFCANLHNTCHQIIRARVPRRPQQGQVHQRASRKRDGEPVGRSRGQSNQHCAAISATNERMALARLAMMIRWAALEPHVIPGAYHANHQTERNASPAGTSEGVHVHGRRGLLQRLGCQRRE